MKVFDVPFMIAGCFMPNRGAKALFNIGILDQQKTELTKDVSNKIQDHIWQNMGHSAEKISEEKESVDIIIEVIQSDDEVYVVDKYKKKYDNLPDLESRIRFYYYNFLEELIYKNMAQERQEFYTMDELKTALKNHICKDKCWVSMDDPYFRIKKWACTGCSAKYLINTRNIESSNPMVSRESDINLKAMSDFMREINSPQVV